MEQTVFKQFSKYTFFNVVGMLGLSCYILADTFFVANGLGSNGLTSLNLAIPIFSFVHGSGLMLGMGAATKYTIYKSRKEHEKANMIFSNTIKLAGVLAIVCIALALFATHYLTQLLGANAQVFTMTKTYIQMILLFSIAFLLNDILLCFIRNDSNPKLAMLAMVSGSLSNVVLDYIFIFPLRMGMFGAVLATCIAPIISISILLTHFFKKHNGFFFITTKIKLTMIKQTLSLGFPSLITEISSGIVIIVFNYLLLKSSGNVGVAAYGIIANLSLVVVAVFTGIAQGIQPLISHAYATSDPHKSKLTLRYAIFTMIIISAFIYTYIYFYNSNIITLFNSENNHTLKTMTSHGLLLYFTCLLCMGSNIILSLYFASINKPKPAHTLSLLRGLIVTIPIAFLLSTLFGNNGIWISVTVSECIVMLISFLYFKKHKHQ